MSISLYRVALFAFHSKIFGVFGLSEISAFFFEAERPRVEKTKNSGDLAKTCFATL